jgi:hypothetical protein
MMSHMYLALLLQIAVASDAIPDCSSGDDSTCADSAHDDTNVLIQRKVDTSRHAQAADSIQSVSEAWTVNPSDFSDTMTMSALVKINGVVQSSGTLASFVGPEVRGVQATTSTPPFGPFAGKAMFQITNYANEGGELLTFKFSGINGVNTLTPKKPFAINENIGSVTDPVVLENEPAPKVCGDGTAQEVGDWTAKNFGGARYTCHDLKLHMEKHSKTCATAFNGQHSTTLETICAATCGKCN